MKRKEFIAQVEKLGLETTYTQQDLFVGIESFWINCISETSQYVIDVDQKQMSKLEEEIKHELFTLATEYAATPLEEREEEKRYVVKKKGDYVNKVGSYNGDSIFVSCGGKGNAIVLSSIEKAQALALLADGEVEEL